MKKLILTTALITIGALGGGYVMFSGQSDAGDIVSVDKGDRVDLIESVDKAEYILLCKGQRAHQLAIIAEAEIKLAKLDAEIAKFEKKK